MQYNRQILTGTWHPRQNLKFILGTYIYDPLSQEKAGIKVNFLVHLQSFISTIFFTSKIVRPLANSFPLFKWHKRLLVDIFFTHRLSKSLAFCVFASINFEPWMGPQDSYIKTVAQTLKLLFQVRSSSEHFNITRGGQLIGNSTEN